MTGLDPVIHVFSKLEASKTWMPGTRPRLSGSFFAGQGARH
jgi:hypothetical protein